MRLTILWSFSLFYHLSPISRLPLIRPLVMMHILKKINSNIKTERSKTPCRENFWWFQYSSRPNLALICNHWRKELKDINKTFNFEKMKENKIKYTIDPVTYLLVTTYILKSTTNSQIWKISKSYNIISIMCYYHNILYTIPSSKYSQIRTWSLHKSPNL